MLFKALCCTMTIFAAIGLLAIPLRRGPKR